MHKLIYMNHTKVSGEQIRLRVLCGAGGLICPEPLQPKDASSLRAASTVTLKTDPRPQRD